MSYYFSKTVSGDFDRVVERVHTELQKEGFGVLSDIDIQAALKKKLGIDFRKYRILGACNPPYAFKTLQAEDKIGIMLPCNVVVQERENGEVEVAIVNPMEAMKPVENDNLVELAGEISRKLQNVMSAL